MEKYKEYLKKYAIKTGISETEAVKHKMVKSYAEYLREEGVDECENQTKKYTTIIACGVAEYCES